MYLNEFDATMQQIKGKWKIIILYQIYEYHSLRFGQLKKQVEELAQTEVSHKTLTEQLRSLETDHLIIRTIYNEVPSRVEYSLTKKGQSLIPCLDTICEWGLEHTDRGLLQNCLCPDLE